MAEFFISYSHSDRDFVDALIPQMRTLYGEGCAWFDDGILGGEEWWNRILREIGECETFIFLISEEAAVSPYCQKELSEALRLKKPIVPVIAKKLQTAYPGNIAPDLAEILRGKQYVDLSTGMRDAPSVTRLWATLDRLKHQRRLLTKLSRSERWILSNQYEILARLDPDHKDYYDQMRKVVESGYELHYDWNTSYIYDGASIMSREECLEVLHILDMFRFLQNKYDQLDDKASVDAVWITFGGFDGNSETKYMAYTRFVIREEGRFTELDQGEDFNTHVPVLVQYRLMVKEWDSSDDPYNLTKDDLVRITSVRPS